MESEASTLHVRHAGAHQEGQGKMRRKRLCKSDLFLCTEAQEIFVLASGCYYQIGVYPLEATLLHMAVAE